MSEILLSKVEQTREEMIESANTRGINDEETIRLSEKLDALLNKYQFEGTFSSSNMSKS
ncbi:aspartyl-phosphate phosphatase Spo0E family protein [Paenisporosarcina cavernae]|uniref:Aspartyl-phosphate phosphatase Spo0E family protein n=1 Tax=Paenisporosarcina cavernae TaxID=2320858 RepID=A0A385YQN5_9BACL|nr:aspartyl-phosphate phosphatase Spo0E family protein [Paenisporosarcina cavernae]AYC29065.1 aspartyl-phosphate phosphatase Spo0E family protein [Paenisporosarcina cavernae]